MYYMLIKLMFKILCYFNQHFNATYYKCLECGMYLKLDAYMAIRFDWLNEIDYNFTELVVDREFYGLPYRWNPSIGMCSYYKLREESKVNTTSHSLLITRHRYSLLVF